MPPPIRVGSYRGPATLVDGDRSLSVAVSLRLREEQHRARAPGWDGRITSGVAVFSWIGVPLQLELPSGRVGDVFVTSTDGFLKGSDTAPFDRN
jgi:hypothetical protein